MPVLMGRRRDRAVVANAGTIASPPPADKVMEAWTGGGGVNETPASRGQLRVLIIDDNRDAADCLSILVRMWGHDAKVAYDGAAGFATANEEIPDVLFVDIGLPKMDGFQMARQLRSQSRFADSLLVAITGWADEPHRRLWAAAFDHYLIKPVDLPALEMLLRDRRRLVWSGTACEQVTDGSLSHCAIWQP